MRKKLWSLAKKSRTNEQAAAKEFFKHKPITELILPIPTRFRKWFWKTKAFSLALARHPLQHLQQYDTVSSNLLHWKSQSSWAKHNETPKKYFQYNLKSAQGKLGTNQAIKQRWQQFNKRYERLNAQDLDIQWKI